MQVPPPAQNPAPLPRLQGWTAGSPGSSLAAAPTPHTKGDPLSEDLSHCVTWCEHETCSLQPLTTWIRWCWWKCFTLSSASCSRSRWFSLHWSWKTIQVTGACALLPWPLAEKPGRRRHCVCAVVWGNRSRGFLVWLCGPATPQSWDTCGWDTTGDWRPPVVRTTADFVRGKMEKQSPQVEMRGHTGSPLSWISMFLRICFHATVLNTSPHNVTIVTTCPDIPTQPYPTHKYLENYIKNCILTGLNHS